MIFAHADILAGVVRCAALTDNNIAGQSRLTTVNLYAESFAF
jgi:hypothetical protein